MDLRSETSMIRYLLGQLPPEGRLQLEELYFADDQLFEELQTVENALIDSYVRGELSESERDQFARCFLNSSERRERVEFAKCLMACVPERSAQQAIEQIGQERESGLRALIDFLRTAPVTVRLGYAAALLTILAFGSITLVENQQLRSELSHVRTELADLRSRGQELEQQIARLNLRRGDQPQAGGPVGESAQLQPPEPSVVSMTLTPGLVRGSEVSVADKLIVAGTARWVVLKLLFEGENYPGGYAAVIQTAEGNEVRRLSGLKGESLRSAKKSVVLRVSAKLFSNGAYVAKLAGVRQDGTQEDVESYVFHVVRR